MSKVDLVSSTADGERLLLKMARVSSVNQDSTHTGLIAYLIRKQHWSPFEMINVCVEITCPRVIARQILRHRSFSFQEFSQRYQIVTLKPFISESRLQDTKNRQASIVHQNEKLQLEWEAKQMEVYQTATKAYKWALDNGIAKEQARFVLPEGNTMSRMYMNGTLRSWIHYCNLRSSNGTQKEHADIAHEIKGLIAKEYPIVAKALDW